MNKELEFEIVKDCIYHDSFGSAILSLLRIVQDQQAEIEELRKSKRDTSALDMFNPGDIMKAAFKK